MSDNGAGTPDGTGEGGANLPAQAGQERLNEPVARRGMFGASTSGDTSGYGRLQVRVPPEVATKLRDEPQLAFELCTGVSGVHYPAETGRELRAVYHLLSITHNRRVRLEVAAPDEDPHIPSLIDVYPAVDWHERETWDFFGIIFDGHPSLTRIEMPDDWKGHPQRKDYPLGGIPVEYRGTKVPPPEERRSYA